MSRVIARGMVPWIVIGIVLLALNLRTPIIAPTGVLGDIRADTGLSAAGAGLLTGLPVLLFALATPLASRTIRRLGAETTVLACLTGVLLGTVLRSAGPTWLVLTGTAIIGLAITLGNIVVPVLIRREVPFDQVAMVTGLYSATMNVGSMVTLIGTGPLAALVGWRWAIGLWGLLAVVGLIYWVFVVRARIRKHVAERVAESGTAAQSSTAEQKRPWREVPAPFRAIVALLVITFSGQSISYYTTTTWLPSMLTDTEGLAPAVAGGTASLFQVAALLGAFGVPLLAGRSRPWVPVAIVAALWLSLPLGLLLVPDAYVVWAITGGIAQGGGFTAIFSIIARTAGSDRETASASARVQGGGYLAATLAPPFAGWLQTTTGGWLGPQLLILTATLAFTIAGLLAARIAGRIPPGGLAGRRETIT